MEQQVVRFRLRDALNWSDGSPLKADDSFFSYEIARALFPAAREDILPYTVSYLVLDERTLEWRGVPGYRSASILQPFFAPLPRHVLGDVPVQELASKDISARLPVGYGAYRLQEWQAGEQIVLVKNKHYFRAVEGLPAFDELTFRFLDSQEAALSALQAGECDILDDTLALETQAVQVSALEQEGKAVLVVGPAASWEHLDFGIASQNQGYLSLFQSKETRQAAALCIDRQRLAEQQGSLQIAVPDTFVSPSHPQANAAGRKYAFDPAAAATLLDAAGWLDADANPATARTALGMNGVPDGTPLAFSLLTTNEPEKQTLASALKDMLAGCGFEVQIQTLAAEELYKPGPEGLVFGRNFQAAQFAWAYAQQPACFLFSSMEIPGNYPQHQKGWGGANVSGYNSPEFDRACLLAQRALPGSPEYSPAQNLFAEDLPVIPLFARFNIILTRPGLCGLAPDPGADSSLWNLELISDSCAP